MAIGAAGEKAAKEEELPATARHPQPLQLKLDLTAGPLAVVEAAMILAVVEAAMILAVVEAAMIAGVAVAMITTVATTTMVAMITGVVAWKIWQQ